MKTTTKDPWQPYEKGNKPSPVPEPATYGILLLLVTAVALAAYKRRKLSP